MSSATPTPLNVYADYTFQVRVQLLGTNGKLRDATTGEVPGLVLRLAATATGAALNAAVGNLAAQERTGDAAIRYVTVDTGLLQTHVLPLGVGALVYAIWSVPGDADRLYVPYVIADRTRVLPAT
jgi:hypothetical protein